MINTVRVESQYGSHPASVRNSALSTSEGGITLAGLLRILIRRRLVVLSTLIACLFAAGAYLALTKPVYRASAQLLPPQQSNIQALLVNFSDEQESEKAIYTPEFVYKAFLDNLKSQGLRREFFEREHLLEYYVHGEDAGNANVDRLFKEKFDDNLQVKIDRTDTSFVSVSFLADDQQFAADILNQLIDFANRRTVDQLVSGVNAALMAEITKVRQQMASKLKLAEQRRLDYVKKLKEARRIAQTLGIQDTSSFPKISDKAREGVAVNLAQVPLYMRGTEALGTEIEVLETRKSDEPFIDGFRDLQERRAFLEGISIDRATLSSVNIDAAAIPPYRQETPRYGLTLALASLLGLMASIMAALIAEFVSAIRSETGVST